MHRNREMKVGGRNRKKKGDFLKIKMTGKGQGEVDNIYKSSIASHFLLLRQDRAVQEKIDYRENDLN